MNESNKLGILKWRTWSAAKKGMVFGAVFAALVTILLQSILMLTQHASSNNPLTGLLYILVALGIPTTLPTASLYEIIHNLFGCRYPEGISPWTIFLMVVVNFIVYGMLGGLIGYAWHQIARLFAKLKSS